MAEAALEKHQSHPMNAQYPEIVTETHTEERSESTEEQKLVTEAGAPKGTSMIKKVTTTITRIRTTTPYTGTI